jgi:hypothetical protein
MGMLYLLPQLDDRGAFALDVQHQATPQILGRDGSTVLPFVGRAVVDPHATAPTRRRPASSALTRIAA